MSRGNNGLPVVYLKAGELHVTDQPSLVITVLGSCLSVTMHSSRQGIGGICHGLLPECGKKNSCTSECLDGFRYVDCSIRQMTGIFDKAGVKRSDIEVKCFGGADMFPRAIEKSGLISVGRQNIMTAEALLKQEGLPIARQDVGGIGGRKLLFYPHTGEVLLQRLVGGREADVRRMQDGVPRHPAGMR